jgi:hypothetical protein
MAQGVPIGAENEENSPKKAEKQPLSGGYGPIVTLWQQWG